MGYISVPINKFALICRENFSAEYKYFGVLPPNNLFDSLYMDVYSDKVIIIIYPKVYGPVLMLKVSKNVLSFS